MTDQGHRPMTPSIAPSDLHRAIDRLTAAKLTLQQLQRWTERGEDIDVTVLDELDRLITDAAALLVRKVVTPS